MYKEYGWKSGATHAHGFILPALLELLNKEKNRSILDVGCGNGYLANYLIDKGFNVYGIDASSEGISNAQKSNPTRFFKQDINSKILPEMLASHTFDTIISTEVIEHLYDPRGYIEFCKSILATNGELIMSTPYHGYFKNLIMALTGTFDRHFTALWDGGHIKFWSKKSLIELLGEFDFKVVEFKGVGRFPYLWKTMFIKVKI
ncbi:MAG: methyltransferase [Candidatus Margulisiibacteriota bacterium]|nr:MAG: methyltransferase [Candidatus Margulisiibacteriota bacterium]